jgi:hypothetical protein
MYDHPPGYEPPPSLSERVRSALEALTSTQVVMLAIGGQFLLCCGAGVSLELQDVPGVLRVTKAEWSRNVLVQEWTPTTVSLFRAETTERPEVPPEDGLGAVAGFRMLPETCGPKYHHTNTTNCSMGSESGSCCPSNTDDADCRNVGHSNDCTYTEKTCTGSGSNLHCTSRTRRKPLCDDWEFDYRACECHDRIDEIACDYDTQVWSRVAELPTKGANSKPEWAVTSLGPLQRTVRGQEFTLTVCVGRDTCDSVQTRSISLEQYMDIYEELPLAFPVVLSGFGRVKEVSRESRHAWIVREFGYE